MPSRIRDDPRRPTTSLVDRRDASYDKGRVRCGRDDRRGARGGWVKSREQSIGIAGQPGDMPRRKVRTPKGAVVGNAHRQSSRYVAPIGTVQQRTDRLEYAAIRDGFEVRVKP